MAARPRRRRWSAATTVGSLASRVSDLARFAAGLPSFSVGSSAPKKLTAVRSTSIGWQVSGSRTSSSEVVRSRGRRTRSRAWKTTAERALQAAESVECRATNLRSLQILWIPYSQEFPPRRRRRSRLGAAVVLEEGPHTSGEPRGTNRTFRAGAGDAPGRVTPRPPPPHSAQFAVRTRGLPVIGRVPVLTRRRPAHTWCAGRRRACPPVRPGGGTAGWCRRRRSRSAAGLRWPSTCR